MDAFQIINALSAAFFGLLGIWAAVVERHWFLRLSVVGVFLLAALLIPAYEIVIEFGVQILLIALAVRVGRHGLRWKWSFSIETALLLMVVFAVIAAIAGQLPELSWQRWLQIVGSGAFAAYGSLLGLWIVCGKSRGRVRAVMGAFGVVLLIALFFVGHVLQKVAMYPAARWKGTLSSALSADRLSQWMDWAVPQIFLGMAIIVVTLTLGRFSGWFIAASEHRTLHRRSVYWARFMLAAMTLAVAAPLIAILLALTTPPPAPMLKLPSSNGYDQFLAAGRITPSDVLELSRRWDSMTMREQRQTFDSLQTVVDKIAVGVELECHVADPYRDFRSAEYEEESTALFHASLALQLRRRFLAIYGREAQLVDECLLDLRFNEEAARGGDVYDYEMASSTAVEQLLATLPNLDSSDCRVLADDLTAIDASREPYERKVAVQKLVDQRSDWETRLNYLLTEWSGKEHNPQYYWDLFPLVQLRLLTVSAAIQAFTLENGQPPERLDELVPVYLAKIPLDPLDSTSRGALKYVRRGANYTLYSNGKDGDDDGGIDDQFANNVGGDTIIVGPAAPSLGATIKKLASKIHEQFILPKSIAPDP